MPQQGSTAGIDPYPNIFILPKKYRSINDVKLRDVIESFPNQEQYYLRFEQMMIGPNRKPMRVWLDVKATDDIAVPNIEGKVRIKALKVPFGLQYPKVQLQNSTARQ